MSRNVQRGGRAGDPEVVPVVFVYGSLKRGQANHHELGAAEPLGDARTVAAYALRSIDGYPALVPGELGILGELYRVADFARLDAFEGEGYVRREVELAGGRIAYGYLAAVPEAGTPLPGDQWPM